MVCKVCFYEKKDNLRGSLKRMSAKMGVCRPPSLPLVINHTLLHSRLIHKDQKMPNPPLPPPVLVRNNPKFPETPPLLSKI